MMQKEILILINLIFGSMVLYSYYNGITKEPQLSAKLWGGIPSILHPIIICFMFISAIGYLFFTYNFFFFLTENYFRPFKRKNTHESLYKLSIIDTICFSVKDYFLKFLKTWLL